MKRWLVMTIVAGGLSWCYGAESAAFTRVKVLKNNSNLRAKALVTSEVVGQVSENEILTAKTMNKDWVEVAAPTNVDLWVLGDYVKDGEINCRQKVNVRAGAGINFNIVGQLSQGEKIDVRGTLAEWVKIAPPPSCSLWISRALVSVAPLAEMEPAKLDRVKTEPVKPVLPQAGSVTAAAPVKVASSIRTPMPVSPPAAPVVTTQTAVAVSPLPPQEKSAPKPEPARDSVFFPPPGLDLVEATGQGRWREVEGVLRAKDFLIRAPSDYRLVSRETGDRNAETVCFVKGNKAQLEALMYRNLVISGREYWVKRQKYPVIVPERIVMK